jgi:hypothetical protein
MNDGNQIVIAKEPDWGCYSSIILETLGTARVLGARLRTRRRSSTTLDFHNEKEFMAFNQIAERPIPVISHPCKSFEWFLMVDEKIGINAGNHAGGIVWVEEASAEFSVPDVAYWGRLQDRFRMVFDTTKFDCAEGT